MKTYIVLDESGAMHLKDERYFVIAGFITREIHKVTSSHKKIEALVKNRKNIPINKKIELKSSRINDSQQALFLNELYLFAMGIWINGFRVQCKIFKLKK